MNTEQLEAAAGKLAAELDRLGIEPGKTTPAELAEDDAAFAPALVDGRTPTAEAAGNFGTEGGL